MLLDGCHSTVSVVSLHAQMFDNSVSCLLTLANVFVRTHHVVAQEGELLARVYSAMRAAARRLEPTERSGRVGYSMYECFRPNIPDGKLGRFAFCPINVGKGHLMRSVALHRVGSGWRTACREDFVLRTSFPMTQL